VVSAVSHEIRNALGAMLVSVSVLGRRMEEAGFEGHRQLDVIRRSIDRVALVLNDVGGLINGRAPEIAPLPLSLVDVITDAVGAVRGLAEVAGITVTLTWPDELPLARIDRARMAQALVALLQAAIKLAPGPGALSLTVDVTGGRQKVRIESAAFDMSASDDPFDLRYWMRRGSGLATGLHLMLARLVVEAHGGTLAARATSARRAARTVVLELPASSRRVTR
jgi:signal transduction histidine kinase